MEGLPKKGGWILITKHVNTERPVHKFGIYFAIPTGKYFFHDERADHAFLRYHPEYNESDVFVRLCHFYDGELELMKKDLWNFTRSNPHWEPLNEAAWEYMEKVGVDELKEEFKIVQQVKVITEHGEIRIQPEEYSICSDEKLQEYMQSVQSGDGFMVYLSKSQQLKGKVAEQVFYLQSRGISYTKALQMCIGQVSTANLFYIYMHPGYVEYFTREPLLSTYYKRHIKAMRESGVEELADQYLGQIRQLEGYESFAE